VTVSKEYSVVEHILMCGEVPSTAKELGLVFGLDGATIRKIINQYRSDGIPICSNNHGYYYSESEEDIVKTIASLKRRIASIQRAIDGLQKNVEVSDAD
jgi:biotin operon repressor